MPHEIRSRVKAAQKKESSNANKIKMFTLLLKGNYQSEINSNFINIQNFYIDMIGNEIIKVLYF